MPGVSAAASLSNALRTSRWNGVAARHSTSVRLKYSALSSASVNAGVVEAAERALLERPVALAVVEFVEEREAGVLQRLEIAPDRPRRDAGPRARSSIVSAARRLEVAQDRPLADDFSVARQRRSFACASE